MLHGIPKSLLSFTRLICHRLLHNNLRRKMDSSNIIINTEEESFFLSFRYVNDLYKIDRQFNFTRLKNEPVDTFLDKISARIKDIYLKKNKKNKQPDINFPVSLINKSSNIILCLRNGENFHQQQAIFLKRKMTGSNEVVSLPEEKSSTTSKEKDSELAHPCYYYFIEKSHDHYMKIENQVYVFDVNPPIVQSVKLPKTCLAGYPVYPSSLEVSNCEANECGIEWLVSDKEFTSEKEIKKAVNQIKWNSFHKGFMCTPHNSHVGKVIKLRVIPKKGERVGVVAEYEVVCHIKEGPGECPFHRRHEHTKNRSSSGELRVMSYNLLADVYSKTEAAKDRLFASCPNFALDMDYRQPLLINEIIGYNSDLICLQEVDYKVYLRGLLPILSSLGFEGDHASKSDLEDNVEGCSIFYRKDKFILLERVKYLLCEELKNNIIFNNLLENISKSDKLLEFVFNRKNILQVLILENKENPSSITIVATTHLYFRPISDNIRLIQSWIALSLLRQIKQLYLTKNPDKKVGIIFCGDFNSVPENAVFRLYTSQYIDEKDVDWVSDPEHEIEGLCLTHDLELSSAYTDIPYTNFTCNFNGWLDYIFYEADTYSLKKVVPLPSHEEVTANIAMPSEKFPSDHIALIADLNIK